MQITKAEINQSIARALSEPQSPNPTDYIGDEEHGDRYIAWAKSQIDMQTLNEDLQWVFNSIKYEQGEVVALHWAIEVMGLARKP